MKFHMVDRIEALEPGKRIVTIKCLTVAEEYLADHFPAFPVMPGVLMLEACVQASAYLVRLMTDWSAPLVVLRQARNVRYAAFVTPGDTLTVESEFLKRQEMAFTFQCVGRVGDATAVQAKITLSASRLADRAPDLAAADDRIVEQMTRRFELCGGTRFLTGGGADRRS